MKGLPTMPTPCPQPRAQPSRVERRIQRIRPQRVPGSRAACIRVDDSGEPTTVHQIEAVRGDPPRGNNRRRPRAARRPPEKTTAQAEVHPEPAAPGHRDHDPLPGTIHRENTPRTGRLCGRL